MIMYHAHTTVKRLEVKNKSVNFLLQSASTQPRGAEEGEMGTEQGGNKDRTLHALKVHELSSIYSIISERKIKQTFLALSPFLFFFITGARKKKEKEKREKYQ